MATLIERKSDLLRKNYKNLKRVKPSLTSLEFSTWISEIYFCCNEFYEYYNPNEDEDPALKTKEEF